MVIAGAKRLLRFDVALDADPTVAENWLYATHRITFASAVRQALTQFDDPRRLRFLFHAVAFIHSGRKMDLATDARPSTDPSDAAEVDERRAIIFTGWNDRGEHEHDQEIEGRSQEHRADQSRRHGSLGRLRFAGFG